jgi:N-acetylglucosamine-6-sulfatase
VRRLRARPAARRRHRHRAGLERGEELRRRALAAVACAALFGIVATSDAGRRPSGPSRPDDYGNSIRSSYLLALGANGNDRRIGTINRIGDLDYFRFVSPFTGYLKVHVTALGGSALDSVVSVIDKDTVPLATDNNSDGGLNAVVNVQVTAGKTYYVLARGLHHTKGRYVLRLRRSAPLGRPANIVLILSDDQSYDSFARMPFVSHLNWYKFTNAYINNATCCPSRATILTGQWSHHTGVESTGNAPAFHDRSTLATWLHDAGYRTALIGKYHLGAVNERDILANRYIPPGWDVWQAWHGIANENAYYNYTLNENHNLVTYGSAPEDYSTDVLARKAVEFIQQSNGSRPFFLYFAPRGPHNPWTAAPRHVGVNNDTVIEKTPNYNEADMSDKPQFWQRLPLQRDFNIDTAERREYDTILSVDDAAKAIIDELQARHLMSNTVIVYMTDNAYSFGQHRYIGKVCQYDECNKTPFLMWYPRGTPRTIDQLISNADLAPTFAALAGIDPGAPVDGHNFLPLITESSVPGWPNVVLLRGYSGNVERDEDVPEFWGIRTPQYKYIETVRTGETELYDMQADPYELQSLAQDPAHAAIKARLAAELLALRSAPPRRPGRNGAKS